jgi:hypothetical protein
MKQMLGRYTTVTLGIHYCPIRTGSPIARLKNLANYSLNKLYSEAGMLIFKRLFDQVRDRLWL